MEAEVSLSTTCRRALGAHLSYHPAKSIGLLRSSLQLETRGFLGAKSHSKSTVRAEPNLEPGTILNSQFEKLSNTMDSFSSLQRMGLSGLTRPHSRGNRHGHLETDCQTTWAIGLVSFGRMEHTSLLDRQPSQVGADSSVVLSAILMVRLEHGRPTTLGKTVFQTDTHSQ